MTPGVIRSPEPQKRLDPLLHPLGSVLQESFDPCISSTLHGYHSDGVCKSVCD